MESQYRGEVKTTKCPKMSGFNRTLQPWQYALFLPCVNITLIANGFTPLLICADTNDIFNRLVDCALSTARHSSVRLPKRQAH